MSHHCEHLDRDLQVVEIWSGVESIAGAASHLGLASAAFDVCRDSAQNILQLQGLREATSLVGRVVQGGLVVLAPECKSFCGLCINGSRRHEQDEGADSKAWVAEGNEMAMVAMMFLCPCVSRGVHCLVENPHGNYFWKYGPVASTLESLNAIHAKVDRCRFVTGRGSKFKKVYNFASCSQFVAELQRFTCRCKRAHERMTTRKCVEVSGVKKVMVTGIKDKLKESAAYPAKLGQEIVNLWHCASRAAGHQPSEPLWLVPEELLFLSLATLPLKLGCSLVNEAKAAGWGQQTCW